MRRKAQDDLAALMNEAAFGRKVLKLAVKMGLVEPNKPAPLPGPIPTKIVQFFLPETLVDEPNVTLDRSPDAFRTCPYCHGLIPDDAYETHEENCKEAVGKAAQT